MRQLAVLSGKGGTGKTSVTAAFAALAGRPVVADCDVDAPNLHLVLQPTPRVQHEFEGGWHAHISPTGCIDCGRCVRLCRFGAIAANHRVDPLACEGCGVCVDHCPNLCITMQQQGAGEWFESTTRFGPMVHAQLGIGQENSGKLVALLRQRAREIAASGQHPLILLDGPPGIGCPAISSLAGVDLALAIAEPTPSGLHDLIRLLTLTRHFGVPAAICVNKADLNPFLASEIANKASLGGFAYVGGIPFDDEVDRAMAAGRTLPEHGAGPAAAAVREVWARVEELLS